VIDLYAAKTPNGRKVAIMLEECNLPYRPHMVDLARGDQFAPEFLQINPNGKIPAILDHATDGDPVPVFESGAVLIYLAEKSARFLSTDAGRRSMCLSWLFWQVGGVGPAFGQSNHFANVAQEKNAYAIDRFSTEAARLVRVLDRQLGEGPYIAGDYSIADMASYPWLFVAIDSLCRARPEITGDALHVRRWLRDVGARPAVQRGMAIGREP
jgi:GSH-dependent disulfide-bond oxidoreductase